MMSPTMPNHQRRSKATLALLTLSLLASCAATKAPGPIADQGSIGDEDVPQVVSPKTTNGTYRDPLVSTSRKKTASHSAQTVALSATQTQTAPAQMAQAQTVVAENTATPAAVAQGGLYAAHAQPTEESSSSNSIVPSGMPTRPIQATVTSVYSLQRPLEPQVQPQPAQPAQAAATHQTRPPTKAEILAGLAPDPNKRRPTQQRPQVAQGQIIGGQMMGGQLPPAVAAQINPATAAQLQGSIPTASPAAADSSAATQMEQIEGAPQAQGMTRDSFIKKFLAKLRNK